MGGSRTWQPWQRLKGEGDGFELRSLAKIGWIKFCAHIEAMEAGTLVSARNVMPIVCEPLVSEMEGGSWAIGQASTNFRDLSCMCDGDQENTRIGTWGRHNRD